MASEKRLIYLQDAVKLLRGKCVAKYPNSFLMGLLASATEIAQMPTVDAVEVVHGRWVTEPWEVVKRCSVCGKLPNAIPGSRNEPCYSPYCPNCGAKMDGERKDNGNL